MIELVDSLPQAPQ